MKTHLIGRLSCRSPTRAGTKGKKFEAGQDFSTQRSVPCGDRRQALTDAGWTCGSFWRRGRSHSPAPRPLGPCWASSCWGWWAAGPCGGCWARGIAGAAFGAPLSAPLHLPGETRQGSRPRGQQHSHPSGNTQHSPPKHPSNIPGKSPATRPKWHVVRL